MSINPYTLAEDRLLGAQAAAGPTTYNCQLVLGGPDAAIEISKELGIRLFLHGQLTANAAFLEFVSDYEEALLGFANEVRVHDDNIVVIAGKWHHVEFHCAPFFSPYVVHNVASTGVVSSIPYDYELFHTDDIEEGRGTFVTIDATSESEIISKLRDATEGNLHLWNQGPPPTSSGQPRLAGALYRPDDVTKSAVYTQFSGRLEAEERAAIRDHLFAKEFSELNMSLADPSTQGYVTEGLRSAHENLVEAISTAAGDLPTKLMLYMYLEFAKSDFGLCDGTVVRRTQFPTKKSLTLREISNSTTAAGFWTLNRFAGNNDNFDPEFMLFDETHWFGNSGDEILEEVAKDAISDNTLGCRYSSQWIDYGSGLEVRFFAFGPVPSLSW